MRPKTKHSNNLREVYVGLRFVHEEIMANRIIILWPHQAIY